MPEKTITVKVVEMGAENHALSLPEGSTVGQALKKAGVKADVLSQKRVRVNKDPAEKDRKLKDKDVVSVTKKVKGG